MIEDDLIYRIAMSLLPGIDTNLATMLLEVFGTPRELFDVTEADLKAVTTLPRGLASPQTRYQALERAKTEIEFLNNKGVTAHWFQQSSYPERLLKANKAPIMVYTVGNTDLNSMHAIGIVGTRHATAYGNSFTENFVSDLADKVADIATISGLAYGIDVAAHRASLSAGIPTVAVVAHGLTRIYPAIHRDTASRMVKNGGMILSDYPHDANVSPYSFLSRNRLIAALSEALVVVESGEQGGALATARLASKCGTPVFAVPGRVTDNYSIGCNKLIYNGIARCIQSSEDLIKAMGWVAKPSTNDSEKTTPDIISTLSHDERIILHHIIMTKGCDNDMLAAITDFPASKIITIMIGLEMRGIVTMEPGNRYQVIKTIDHSKLLDS